MMRRACRYILPWVALLVLSAGCSAVSKTPSVPPSHPEEMPAGRVECLDCHEKDSPTTLKPYANIRHSRPFVESHGIYTRQSQNLCSSCHPPAYCQACHAGKEQLKPNIRTADRPDLRAPHRGDYLFAHRIEGRIDPGSCFRCHGNRNNMQCRQCHR